ncbi:hypothetical protein V9T40_001128 [Parthenolecanium corni]|uniref:Alpha-soluble NSF attachment protein n=1 Tax=Parthenolecanium corni TaxID=536013 RepID=A0AAN9Y127_9HEMI
MADGSNEQKALALIAEAEKKLNSSKTFLGSLFGGSSKLEDALECYQRAGNLFKMDKKWGSAGSAYIEAALLHGKSGNRHDAATNYVDASHCFKKSDLNEAVKALLKAIEIYTDMGRFTMAAKQHQSIAEMYETEFVDFDKAIYHYQQAADYYRGEESNASANKCLLKVAQYSAQLENYSKAIEIYEEISKSSLESAMLKYSVKEYFFRATLCHMCVDVLAASRALERYIEMYPAFQDSRECKLLKVLMDHVEEQNSDGFTEAVKDYDSISRLDQWYTTMLLRIKKQVNETPDLC